MWILEQFYLKCPLTFLTLTGDFPPKINGTPLKYSGIGSSWCHLVTTCGVTNVTPGNLQKEMFKGMGKWVKIRLRNSWSVSPLLLALLKYLISFKHMCKT